MPLPLQKISAASQQKRYNGVKYNVMKEQVAKLFSVQKNIQILKILKPFTKETTPAINKICNRISRNHNVKILLLDFTKTAEIHTTAFACMVNFLKRHSDAGIKIGLINLNKTERELLKLLSSEKIMHTFKSQKQAIDFFTKKQKK